MPNSPAAPSPAPLKRWPSPHWTLLYWAALVPLLLLKVGLAGHMLWLGVAYDSLLKFTLTFPMMLGADLLSALLCAGLIALILRATRARSLTARLAVAAPLLFLHGAIAAFSTLCITELGGPLNKQLIDASLFVAENWSPEMAASADDYLSPTIWLIIALSGLLGVALYAWAPQTLQGRAERRRRFLSLNSVGILWTFALLPFQAGGQLGPRISTNGLERSPWPELVSSYLREPLRDLMGAAAHRAPPSFRFDFASLQAPEARVRTPLVGATPRPSSVLFIQLESIGARYLEVEEDPMPFVQSLRARPDAVDFRQHYASWSLTSHAAFSIFCAEMPLPSHRSIAFINPAIPCVSLSEALHGAGWATALVTPGDLDFDHQRRFLRYRHLDQILDAKTLPNRERAWRGAWGYEEPIAVAAGLDFVDRNPDKPFFLYYQSLAGHHPFLATEAQAKNPLPTREENYYEALRAADGAVRALVEGLEARGRLDDTLVIIVADHGEGHGARAGRNTWQPVVHVPLVMFGPQTRGLGGQVEAVTSHIDLAPTVLSLLDQPIPCTMKGRDLRQESEARVAIFGGRPPRYQVSLIDEHWKFILEDGHKRMLFDLRSDPEELIDLSAEQPQITARYDQLIDTWQHQATSLIENYASLMKRADCHR